MRRALIVLTDLEPGGAERVMATVVRHLPRERFELHLALIRRRGRLLEEIPAHVTIHDLGASRVRHAALAIVRLVWKLRPDVLASTLGHLNLALLLLRPFLPPGLSLVIREANTVSAELAGRRRAWLWSMAYRLLYPRADLVLCNADAMFEDLAETFGVSRERLRYVPNPVDVERIREQAAQASPYSGFGPHLLGVGRLVAQKGFDRLLDAFALVNERQAGAELWILGDGPDRQNLAERAARLGIMQQVHWMGWIPDPYHFMAHADVFVLTSHFEGLPNALLEALACGTRCAAFDAPGGVRELLEGLPGSVLVPDGDISALADALVQLMGAEAPKRPELPRHFHLDDVIEAYAEILEGG